VYHIGYDITTAFETHWQDCKSDY